MPVFTPAPGAVPSPPIAGPVVLQYGCRDDDDSDSESEGETGGYLVMNLPFKKHTLLHKNKSNKHVSVDPYDRVQHRDDDDEDDDDDVDEYNDDDGSVCSSASKSSTFMQAAKRFSCNLKRVVTPNAGNHHNKNDQCFIDVDVDFSDSEQADDLTDSDDDDDDDGSVAESAQSPAFMTQAIKRVRTQLKSALTYNSHHSSSHRRGNRGNDGYDSDEASNSDDDEFGIDSSSNSESYDARGSQKAGSPRTSPSLLRKVENPAKLLARAEQSSHKSVGGDSPPQDSQRNRILKTRSAGSTGGVKMGTGLLISKFRNQLSSRHETATLDNSDVKCDQHVPSTQQNQSPPEVPSPPVKQPQGAAAPPPKQEPQDDGNLFDLSNEEDHHAYHHITAIIPTKDNNNRGGRSNTRSSSPTPSPMPRIPPPPAWSMNVTPQMLLDATDNVWADEEDVRKKSSSPLKNHTNILNHIKLPKLSHR